MFANHFKFILSPPDSAFDRLKKEQQSTVSAVSLLLEVMVLASLLPGLGNAVPILPGSDSWLSKEKKKSEACSCTSWLS